MGKSFLKSKTLWVNVFGFTAIIVQGIFGWVIPPEWQGLFLTAANALLRLITKEPVNWS